MLGRAIAGARLGRLAWPHVAVTRVLRGMCSEPVSALFERGLALLDSEPVAARQLVARAAEQGFAPALARVGRW